MVKDKEYLPRSVPNPHIMIWEVRKRLTDARIMTFDSKDWKSVSDADELGWLGRGLRFILGLRKAQEEERKEELRFKPFVNDLFGIHGVTSVTIEQYSFSVDKAKLYTWEEVMPMVERVFEKHWLAE